MSVITARTAGFCWGVRRAVDLVLAELRKDGGPWAVHGELVHNPQVLQALGELGVSLCTAPGETTSGTLFLRTHGTELEEKERLSALPVRLRDLTCPRVGRVLALARKAAGEGRDVLILGDADHQEVRAILSYGAPRARVLAGPGDVPGLPDLERPILLSQTTADTEVWSRTEKTLRERFPGLEASCTVCDSTELRQAELRELCPRVDCVVVVGGRKSANTRRLVDIAREQGLPAILVETPEELDPRELKRYDRVLLTAGASTPSWSIRRVRERLLEIQGTGLRSGPVRRVLRTLVYGNFHVLPVAFAVGVAGGMLTGCGNRFPQALAAALFLFGSHSLTSVLESGYSKPSALRRQDFLRKNRRLFTAFSVTAFGASAGLSLMLAPIWTWVLGVMLIAFLAWSLPLMRGASPFRGLRAVPGSRDVMFAGAWSFLLAFLPGILVSGGSPQAGPVLWAGALFFLFLARCLLADLTDLQGDALMGLDTIPIHTGSRRSIALFWVCVGLAALLPAGGIAAGLLPPESAGLGLGLLSLCAGFFILRSASFPSELFKRGIADGSLLAAGLGPVILCRMTMTMTGSA